jgi:N-acyl-D-aspartate/D-glutamate deacylase
MSDLLVRGGRVVDGSGQDPVAADIRVRGGRILEVGPDLLADGEPEFDASGALVTPGFIDGHTHHDPSLFWDPGCDPLPGHGVTTVVTGNCSLSLAPLRAEHRGQLIDMFCFIEDLPVEAFQKGLPWNWESFAEYRTSFDERGAAVNQASLVGHSALRLFVMGEAAFERASNDAERAEIQRIFEECLQTGACGLSTSFADVDRSGRPVPSRFADDPEFLCLLHALRAHGRGVLEFVPQMNDPEAQVADIERVHRLGCATGIPATWTQLVISAQNGAQVEALLAQAARTQAEGPGVYPQVSPRPFDVNLSFESTPLFHFQRSWHDLVQAGPDEKRRLLRDEAWRQRARDEFDAPGPTMFPKDRPTQILLTRANAPSQERWLGSSLSEIAEQRDVHLADALADLVLENDLDPGITMINLSNEDPEQVARLITSPMTLCAASDAGAHAQMMCGAGDSTLLLTKHVREREDLTLPEAVRRMTFEIANFFGLSGRGLVAEGYAADLTVFDLEALRYPKPEFVSDLPGGGRRLSRAHGGYRATLVGGVVTHLEGVATGAYPGRMLEPGA